MAFLAGFDSRILVGPLAFSAFCRGFNIGSMHDMLDATVMDGSKAKSSIPGQSSGSVSMDLLLDSSGAAGSQFATLNTWSGTPQPETLAFEGTATGKAVWLVLANLSQATVTGANAAVTAVAVTVQPDGPVDAGTSLEDLTAITSTANGTARDGGAASTNGGVAHIHATAFAGITNNIVTIEHSVDGSTAWATLVTFATITGVTSQRVTVAAATTVRRYLRVVDTVTGTGSNTRQVSFARR